MNNKFNNNLLDLKIYYLDFLMQANQEPAGQINIQNPYHFYAGILSKVIITADKMQVKKQV